MGINNNIGMYNNMKNNYMFMNNNNMFINNNMGMNSDNNIENKMPIRNNNTNNNKVMNCIDNNMNNSNDEFTIYFRYKAKEFLLDCSPDITFNEVIQMFLNKYKVIKINNIKSFIYNDKMITEYHKTIRELEIEKNSYIFIKD